MVKITTSARVYSPELDPELVTQAAASEDEREIEEREKDLARAVEEIRSPRLEGDWDDLTEGVYDAIPKRRKGRKKKAEVED